MNLDGGVRRRGGGGKELSEGLVVGVLLVDPLVLHLHRALLHVVYLGRERGLSIDDFFNKTFGQGEGT